MESNPPTSAEADRLDPKKERRAPIPLRREVVPETAPPRPEFRAPVPVEAAFRQPPPVPEAALRAHMQQQAEAAPVLDSEAPDTTHTKDKKKSAPVAVPAHPEDAVTEKPAPLPAQEQLGDIPVGTPVTEAAVPAYFAENSASERPMLDAEPVPSTTPDAAWMHAPARPIPAPRPAAEQAAPAAVLERPIPAPAHEAYGSSFEGVPDDAQTWYRRSSSQPPHTYHNVPPQTPNTPPPSTGDFEGSFHSFASGGHSYAPSIGYASPADHLRSLLRIERAPHTHWGIIGGLLLVHLLSRRRDNRLGERIDTLQQQNAEQQKQNTQATQELQRTQQQLHAEQRQSAQVTQELQQTQQQHAEAIHWLDVISQPDYLLQAPPTTENHSDISPLYTATTAAGMAANRDPRLLAQPEQRPTSVTVKHAAEQQPGVDPDQAPEQFVDQNGNVVQLQPGDKVRRSAWHTYIERNGKVVEGVLEYGDGFKQEQDQERGHVAQYDNSRAGAATGASFGVGHGSMYGIQNPSLPSGMTTPALPAGQSQADIQHRLSDHTKNNQVASNVANPWFWVMLILIFAAFFITITV